MSGDAGSHLVCILPNWIGDAVQSLPALHVLGESGVPLRFIGRRAVRRIVADVPGEPDWVDLPAGRLARLRLARRLGATQGARGTLLLTPSFSSALFAWMLRAPVRYGESADGRAFLLTHPRPRIDRRRHLAVSYQDLALGCLDALGVPAPPVSASPPEWPWGLRSWPHLEVSVAERAGLQSLPEAARGAVLVAPGARFGPAKQYPPERFARAAAALARTWECAVVLVGTEQDTASTQAVREHLDDAIDLTGRTDLGQLLAVLQAARVVLSNDSGTMHLAAAVGAPVVGVFGSTNPGWTAPLGPRAQALSHPVFCWPCYARRCAQDFRCMLGQPAEKLVAAAQRLVDNGCR